MVPWRIWVAYGDKGTMGEVPETTAGRVGCRLSSSVSCFVTTTKTKLSQSFSSTEEL